MCVCFLSACHDDPRGLEFSGQHLGLAGKTVNQLVIAEGNLFAATNAGLYVKPVNGGEFELVDFEQKNVQAIEWIGEGGLLASIYVKDGTEPPSIFRSADRGETWEPLGSPFGDEIPEPVFDFFVDPDNADVWYASGPAVIGRSDDHGQSWAPIYGAWRGLATGISVVTKSPFTGEMWAGGQGAIENGFLLRSENEVDWDQWYDLADNPSVVKEIAFVDDNQLYVGFEGALLKTVDNGESWQTLIDSDVHKFFFGIRVPAGRPNRVYTAGWIKTRIPRP